MDDFILRTKPKHLNPLVDDIVELANSERNSLGFVPQAAYGGAIERGRLLALVRQNNDHDELVGFIFFSGVRTTAKIQQIATAPKFRRKGVAKTLVRSLVDLLEKNHYLSVQADVASDLEHAKSFYKSNGFEIVKERPGGKTRDRRILIHARFLETPSLFDYDAEKASKPKWQLPNTLDETAKTFALDVMVYFDFVKKRRFREDAERLFKAALSHEIRVAVAAEFCAELKKAGEQFSDDPLYNFATQLPTLPTVDNVRLNKRSEEIYDEIFTDSRVKGYGKDNSRRDSNHLAHASLVGVDAFVTRDKSLLRASAKILSKFNLDILSPEELVTYLPNDMVLQDEYVEGQGFTIERASVNQAKAYLAKQGLPRSLYPAIEAFDETTMIETCRILHVDGVPKACVAMITTRHTSPMTRAVIHVKPEAIEGELYADALLNVSLSACAKKAVSTIQFIDLPGQSYVRATLRDAGFVWNDKAARFEKVVIGRPVLPYNWEKIVNETRRRTGIKLPSEMPSFQDHWKGKIAGPNGQALTVSFEQLEALIGPVLIASEDRPAVVVPIQRAYSEMLFGESKQMSLALTGNKDAQFQRQRIYVSDIKRPTSFEKGGLIFFYESARNNGSGSIVAVGRIVDTLVVTKLSDEDRKKIVIDDISGLSKSDRVLQTRFDNIFMLNVPVLFDTLKRLKIPDGTNFVTATSIESHDAIKILKKGGF